MKFGPWDIPDNQYFESVQRCKKAFYIDDENVYNLDTEKGTCCIKGSGEEAYTVSLSGCDCVDFTRRGWPCKHMFRLALELGYEFKVPQFDPYAAHEYNVQEDIDRLTFRWCAGQLTEDALQTCIKALKASASQAKGRRGRPKKHTGT